MLLPSLSNDCVSIKVHPWRYLLFLLFFLMSKRSASCWLKSTKIDIKMYICVCAVKTLCVNTGRRHIWWCKNVLQHKVFDNAMCAARIVTKHMPSSEDILQEKRNIIGNIRFFQYFHLVSLRKFSLSFFIVCLLQNNKSANEKSKFLSQNFCLQIFGFFCLFLLRNPSGWNEKRGQHLYISRQVLRIMLSRNATVQAFNCFKSASPPPFL